MKARKTKRQQKWGFLLLPRHYSCIAAAVPSQRQNYDHLHHHLLCCWCLASSSQDAPRVGLHHPSPPRHPTVVVVAAAFPARYIASTLSSPHGCGLPSFPPYFYPLPLCLRSVSASSLTLRVTEALLNSFLLPSSTMKTSSLLPVAHGEDRCRRRYSPHPGLHCLMSRHLVSGDVGAETPGEAGGLKAHAPPYQENQGVGSASPPREKEPSRVVLFDSRQHRHRQLPSVNLHHCLVGAAAAYATFR